MELKLSFSVHVQNDYFKAMLLLELHSLYILQATISTIKEKISIVRKYQATGEKDRIGFTAASDIHHP